MIVLLILVAIPAAVGLLVLAMVLVGTQPPMPTDMPSQRAADLERAQIPA